MICQRTASVMLAALFGMSWAADAAACGTATDCSVDGGTYRIALPPPDAGRAPAGAIMFFHGWQGTAAGIMRNRALIEALGERNIALIAPQGVGKSWTFPSSPSQNRDDFDFVHAVLADAEKRFSIPPGKTVASGFSLGGSMVWYLACRMSDAFAGFAPVAGAFWDPIPDKCDAPGPDIVHVHGTSDRTVPMAGRPIGEHWHQGDVFESFELLTGGPTCPAPAVTPDDGGLTCRTVSPCGGRLVELCLHTGGHSIRSEWVVRAFDQIAERKGLFAD